MTSCQFFLSLIIAMAPGFADESDFETAKANYDAEVGKIYTVISEAIDKRLVVAQKSGQAQTVAAVLAEQKAFVDYGDIPPKTPVPQQKKLAELAKIMDEAYFDELKNLTKSMMLVEAEALKKAQADFRQRIAIQTTRITLMGTWKLQMGSYNSNFTFYPDGTMFHSTENFRGTWRVDLTTQQIIVSPPGGGGGDQINLPLDPKGTSGLSSSGGVFKLTKTK